MLADILKAITQKDDQLSNLISSQNDNLTTQINQIDELINSIDIEQVTHILYQNQVKFSKALPSDPVVKNIFILQEFFTMSKQNQKQNKKCVFLLEQISSINDLSINYNLVQTLVLKDSQPNQEKITFVKATMTKLSEQLHNYKNQQAINQFESENGEPYQELSNVISFLEQFSKTAFQIYKNLITSTYSVQNSKCSIQKQYFKVIWTELQEFYQQFIKSIAQFFQQFITYDVNDRQYTLKIFQTISNQRELALHQKSKIIFDNSEVRLHYDVLLQSLANLKQFLQQLQFLTQKQQLNLLVDLKKSIFQKIKQYFQYLLPYLNMEARRTILQSVASSYIDEDMSIYDLLVSLKMNGQDAQKMVSTIEQMLNKIEQNPQNLKIIMKFIDLAKQNRKNYNMILFISDQLIDGFEDKEEISESDLKTIKQLFNLREQMRIKIHEVQN